MPNAPSGPQAGPASGGASGGTSTYDLAELEKLDRGPSRWRPFILIGAAVLLFAVAGTTAFLIGSSSTSSDAPAADSEYDVTLVASEDTDSEALSPDHLLPEKVEVADGGTYSLVHSDDAEDCADAGQGDFGGVLADAECRQVVRGVYASDEDSTAVTVGVAAFPSNEAAAEVADAQDIDSGEWFAALPGPEDSPAADLDAAGGHASGLTWGRYHVFSLAADTEEGDGEALAALSEEFLTVPFVPLGDRALAEE